MRRPDFTTSAAQISVSPLGRPMKLVFNDMVTFPRRLSGLTS